MSRIIATTVCRLPRRQSLWGFLLACFVCLGAGRISAQTDPMFTSYMFNPLAYNPAYAGSREYLTAELVHRRQWMGMEQAPTTLSFSIHSPLPFMNKVALGANLTHQQIGTSQISTINGMYAFRIPLGKSEKAGKVAVAIQGGMTHWRTDLSGVEVFEGGDQAYGQENVALWLPNFGVGMYYSNPDFFFGVSLPNMLDRDIREENVTSPQNARTFRHYYVTAGGAIPLRGKDLILKPMAIFRSVAIFSGEEDRNGNYVEYGAPKQVSLDLSLFIKQKLWVGLAYRTAVEAFQSSSSADSANLWAAYYFDNGLHLGLAYDYGLTEMQAASGGSVEAMVGYDFQVDKQKTYHPRYF